MVGSESTASLTLGVLETHLYKLEGLEGLIKVKISDLTEGTNKSNENSPSSLGLVVQEYHNHRMLHQMHLLE